MFFDISVAVNLVLINMMIAIINMAFEEIKENEAKFQSKFALTAYIKKFTREVVGLDLARPIKVKYTDPNAPGSDEEEMDDTQVSGNWTRHNNFPDGSQGGQVDEAQISPT